MTTINRRVMLALMGATAAAPAFAQEAEAPAAAAPADAAATPDVALDFSLGNADAPVKIKEYVSFSCPHCATFHAEVFKKLKAEYIDTGKVHFTMREVYMNAPGIWGAILARCGGEARYWGISDMLFSTQQEWFGSGQPDEIINNLRTMGLKAGLTDEQFNACFSDEASLDIMLKNAEAYTTEDAVTGTPTLFIDGELSSARSWADVKAAIDAKLGG